MLTIKEVAERLKMSLSEAYELCSTRELPHYKIGKRMKRVSEEQLAQFLAEREVKRERGTDEPRKLQQRPRPRVVLKHL